jgi:hypothetical protein
VVIISSNTTSYTAVILFPTLDIFVGDPVEKTPEEQISLEEAILELVGGNDIEFDDN